MHMWPLNSFQGLFPARRRGPWGGWVLGLGGCSGVCWCCHSHLLGTWVAGPWIRNT